MRLIACLAALAALTSCFSMPPPQLPPADTIVSTVPIEGNSGQFMSPYTSYGTVSEWVKKAQNAGAAQGLGSAAGQYLGGKALEQVPFVGGWLGGKAGGAMAKEAAIAASGGWNYIKDTSDLSFDSAGDLAVYIYANHGTHPDYAAATKATFGIYPEVETQYYGAILGAPRRTPALDGSESAGITPEQDFASLGATFSEVDQGEIAAAMESANAEVAEMMANNIRAEINDIGLAEYRDMTGAEWIVFQFPKESSGDKFSIEQTVEQIRVSQEMMAELEGTAGDLFDMEKMTRDMQAAAIAKLSTEESDVYLERGQKILEAMPSLYAYSKEDQATLEALQAEGTVGSAELEAIARFRNINDEDFELLYSQMKLLAPQS